MIKELNQTCEKVNDFFGVTVKLPNPKKRKLKGASVHNFVVGVGLIVASAIFAQKWCAVAGGLSIISSIILMREVKGK